MIKRFIITTLALFITNSFAEYDALFTSLNAGGSFANDLHQNTKLTSGVMEGLGANLFLGAPANEYFAPEVGANYFGVNSIGRVGILSLDGRFTLPVHKNILLFTKVGIGWAEVKTCYITCTNTDSMAPTLGLGVGYGFTPDWVGTLEANGAYFTSNTRNARGVAGLITLGVTRFWNG